MDITVRELRSDTKKILDAVEKGESVTITRRGKPAARLQPVLGNQPNKKKPLAGFGMWADREDMQDVQTWLRNIRKPRYSLHEDPGSDQ